MPIGKKAREGNGNRYYTETVTYKNTHAAVKRLNIGTLHISKALLNEVKAVKEMQHENVNTFIALCVESPNVSILMLYGQRGSVYDVLAGGVVQLTPDIKVSLATDIAAGMNYLHRAGIMQYNSHI